MPKLLAVLLALFVLATALAPHVHEGPLGRHACPACVASDGEAAAPTVALPAPQPAPPDARPQLARAAPVTGAPLGAVPGQSPPVA